MTRKVIIIRHMQEKRDDHVAHFLNQNNISQVHTNPAHGVGLPGKTSDLDALVIYGGIQSANDGDTRPYIAEEIDWITDWLAAGKPTLGICLGGQLVAKCLGATVSRHPEGLTESGFTKLVPATGANGFLEGTEYFYQWHNEGFSLPDNCELLARGETFPNQAFRYRSNTYGLQFHPEVSREVMLSWLKDGAHALSAPGAHSAERQKTDELKFGTRMGQWCRDFLDHWSKTW